MGSKCSEVPRQMLSISQIVSILRADSEVGTRFKIIETLRRERTIRFDPNVTIVIE